jgi:hypothetical protein
VTHDDTGPSVPALRTTRLGKRYGPLWGLRAERRGQDDVA